MLHIASPILVLLATLRLTRLFTTDWLGEWLFVGPIKAWAQRAEERNLKSLKEDPLGTTVVRVSGTFDTWQGKLAKGFDCPFCIGFWVGFVVITVTMLSWTMIPILFTWSILMAAFSLNYVVGHISSRID